MLTWWRSTLSAAAVAVLAVPVLADETPSAERDTVAARYLNSCAGCHSLTGVKLNGPELSPTAAWPDDQLKAAIKRMEKNVGPLSEDDLNGMVALLKDPNVRNRLKAEEARIQAQFVAKLEPPNASIGHGLYYGSVPFKNGGMSCVACHAVSGHGGNLGPDLTGVFARMGETPLVSSIEKASFKVMATHYREHPITRQEALHLTKYFASLDPNIAPRPSLAYVPVGAGGGLACLVLLAFYYRSQRTRRETKLQRRGQSA
jgi:mono/diheme cytochrome c family protein